MTSSDDNLQKRKRINSKTNTNNTNQNKQSRPIKSINRSNTEPVQTDIDDNIKKDFSLPPEKLESLFRYYSELKFQLLNNTFKWTIKVLAVVFSVTTIVSLICSVFDTRLHCATILPSHMVTAWIIFSITTFIVMLGIIFLFTTDGKEISKALIDTNKLIVDNKSFFGKIFNHIHKRTKES